MEPSECSSENLLATMEEAIDRVSPIVFNINICKKILILSNLIVETINGTKRPSVIKVENLFKTDDSYKKELKDCILLLSKLEIDHKRSVEAFSSREFYNNIPRCKYSKEENF